jgi:precorrin-2/cobalt-factor-2 C20-methyltransferase
VPGVTSIFAFAAQAKMSLAEGDETVAIIPACYDLNRIKKVASCCDTLIFLKDGRYFDSVIEMLSEAGFGDDSAIAIAQDISVEGEILKMNKLRDMVGTKGPTEKYFSIMIAKKKNHDRK